MNTIDCSTRIIGTSTITLAFTSSVLITIWFTTLATIQLVLLLFRSLLPSLLLAVPFNISTTTSITTRVTSWITLYCILTPCDGLRELCRFSTSLKYGTPRTGRV